MSEFRTLRDDGTIPDHDILMDLGDLKWVKADLTGDNEEKGMRNQIMRWVSIKVIQDDYET